MRKNNLGFTIVELLVVVIILTILSTIGFLSLNKYTMDARDTQRESDISALETALVNYKAKRGSLPYPGDYFTLTNGATNVARQGKMNTDVILSNIDEIPKDPKNGKNYSYSVTNNRREFQVAGTLEGQGVNKAILKGNYKTVSKNILPTIILATDDLINKDITTAANKKLFVFNKGLHNLVYTFNGSYNASSDGTDLADLISNAGENFWQNSDFINCSEIEEAAKNIGDGEYQVYSGGVLTNDTCTF